jgi:hypothetical protein
MPTLRTFPQPKHAERKEVQGDMFLDMYVYPSIQHSPFSLAN